MPDRPSAASDRPPVHPSRGPSRLFAVRLKVPDAERLVNALDAGDLSAADYLRSVIIGALDAREAEPDDPMT